MFCNRGQSSGKSKEEKSTKNTSTQAVPKKIYKGMPNEEFLRMFTRNAYDKERKERRIGKIFYAPYAERRRRREEKKQQDNY